MIKSLRQKIIFISVYAAVTAVCYFLILFGSDFGLQFETYRLCFAVIVINSVCSLLLFDLSRDNFLVAAALAVTLFADYFLVLKDERAPGMFVFCFAQVFYFLRNFFTSSSKKMQVAGLITALGLFIVFALGGVLLTGKNFEAMVIYAAFYLALLVCNIVFAGIHIRSNLIFFIGLILFIFCDFFVGLGALCDIISAPAHSLIFRIVYYPFNFIWLFYVPSQALIVISMIVKKTTPLTNGKRLFAEKISQSSEKV